VTLIVGVRCSNGVVMGADSAATFAAFGGQRTIRDEHIRKIQVLEGRLILGSAGSVAMSQRITPVLVEILKQRVTVNSKTIPPMSALAPGGAADLIRRVLYEKVFQIEVEAAAGAHRAGWGSTSEEAISSTMVALPLQPGPALFTFNAVGLPEEVSESLFCCNMGSGQPIADPFMGFIRRVLWHDAMPTVEQATLGVIWCLDHTIQLHPGGVGGNVQVAVLEKDGNTWKAHELSNADCAEHRQNLAVAEGLLKDWHAGKLPAAAPAVPAPPVPASTTTATTA
jgi:20S proteasome alpha/beta subunit